MITGQDVGQGALIGFGSGLMGGALSRLSVNNIVAQGAINIGAGGVFGGTISVAMGGNFWKGAATGALSSAVGWGVSKATNYIANKMQRMTAVAEAEKIIAEKLGKNGMDDLKKLREIQMDKNYKGIINQSEIENMTAKDWNDLKILWQETYGTDTNLKISNNFDLTQETLKFSELHIRYDGVKTYSYHYDYNDIVLKPLTHIIFDTLYQGFKHNNW